MSMLQARIVVPSGLTNAVLDVLAQQPGATNVLTFPGAARKPVGDLVIVDLARECTDSVVGSLRELGVLESGSLGLVAIDTALGNAVVQAERSAPGEASDAVVWDEVTSRTREDATLTWSFVLFLCLATMLAAIGVITDSPITVVGAMVVGPEFGPLAGIALGLMRGKRRIARRAVIALGVGFPVAIAVTAVGAVLARATGLVHASDLAGQDRLTRFIYEPGAWSLITALIAGAAGMLSLTSSKSAVLVGVFISVTTVPAAGNVAVGLVLGLYGEALGSAVQLFVNLIGIVVAACLVLALQLWLQRRSVITQRQPTV
jgi:uncharacterized hydrophobic protein (TIGR00271 family)